MHLCFIDESGTPPNRPNPDQPYFTLAAAIIKASDWHGIADDVHGFAVQHGLRGELKWRFFAPGNRAGDNPLLAKGPEERKELSLAFARLLARTPITVIACVTDIDASFRYGCAADQQSLYHFCYKPLSERFQYFLQDCGSIGIVIADHRGRDNDRMFKAHHQAMVARKGINVSAFGRFVEGLFLQDSHQSIGIQIADFVAGAIHRAYSTGDSEHAAILKPMIRARPDGSILGFGIVQHPKDRFTCRNAKRTPGETMVSTP